MSAILSDCGTYRYFLYRAGDLCTERQSALFLMLNPSTADAEKDDPTIRRCRAFAKQWNCNGMAVINLFALRATDPKELQTHPDPVGPDNDYWISKVAKEYFDVVCAWGANAPADRVAASIKLLKESGARLWCLGTTKSGAPRHPLYVRGDQQLIPWEAA